MKVLVTCLLIYPFTFFSQKKDTTATKKHFIGFTFSPDYCYRTLKSNSSSQSMADYRDGVEIPKFGFTTGVNLKLKITKRFSFETAILLSDKGEKTENTSANGFIAPTNQVDPLLPLYVRYNYHYMYFDIPIKANYYFLTKKTKIFLSAGVSSNVFLFQKAGTVLEYMDGHKERNSSFGNPGFSRINLALLAGFGFEYAFSDKLHLKIEPIFRHSITSIIDAPIKGYLYSVGMNSGIYYSL